jgi:hypothetical protein
MKSAYYLLFLLSAMLCFGRCTGEISGTTPGSQDTDPNSPQPMPDWLIPEGAVLDGGPGKDGIAAISNPRFIPVQQAFYMNDDDLVLGIRIGEEVRAYPHNILFWHEIVNDRFDDTFISITYCPLTGTGVGWDRALNAGLTTFGVSGLLYNTNMIAYDRRTDSNWSQMLLKCVNGDQIGTRINTYPIIETSWRTWKEMFPQTQLLSLDTGFDQNYAWTPYTNYSTNHEDLYFPVEIEDNRLPLKERVLGVIVGDRAKAYRFNSFPEQGVGVVNDGLFGKNIVVVGSNEKNFMAAFNSKLEDGTLLGFKAVNDALPTVMMDQEGTMWDIFGKAVSGPRAGTQLESFDAFIGFWFAWGAFYPSLKFY